jgi:LPS export ABC transporter permease LptG/LPS export ABC transporter permease LptF
VHSQIPLYCNLRSPPIGAAAGKMRLLTRYIFKEIASHSLLGLLIFTFVLYIPNLNRMLELIVRRDLPGASVLLLLLAPVPAVLVLTIPMAVLVGVLIGLSRMSADGEVIAARAAGMKIGTFIRPVMLYASVGFAIACWMSLSLGPQATWQLTKMENELKASEAPYAIEPRVFIEQFPRLLLYLKDVTSSHALWRGVFIADTSNSDLPKITVANSGQLVNHPASHTLTLHLENGTQHEIDPQDPARYSIASFAATDIPISLSSGAEPPPQPRSPPMMRVNQLWAATHDPVQHSAAWVELNYRFALPFASLVLALAGTPLGLFTRKGGKSIGVMLAILLVFVYYIIFALGFGYARQSKLNPVVGLWTANLVFVIGALFMLSNRQLGRSAMQAVPTWFEGRAQNVKKWWSHHAQPKARDVLLQPRKLGGRWFQILDLYVIRSWVFYFALMLVTLTGIYIIFDFFQILGDVVWRHIPAAIILKYYIYLLPQIIYLMLPLSILVATLINFSVLTKSNQITAIKAAGISLYRISVPVLMAAALLSGAMFLLGDEYLPTANQHQDALRNIIKGRPAQTYLSPGRQWIFGKSERIYNYHFFDPDRNVFASLSVFDMDSNFRLVRRLYAKRAFWEPNLNEWVLEDGWERKLDGDKVTDYMPFSVAGFRDLTEPPAYFKKDVRTSEQMSVLELERYVSDLKSSGFDVVRLSVQLYRKFSYPLIAFVVALIGIPFSFTAGRKGALTGVAISLGIAIVYWSTSSLFEAMGNLNQLPPAVAAWTPDVLFGLGGAYLLLRVKT